MEIHDHYEFGYWMVVRVVGGWLYVYKHNNPKQFVGSVRVAGDPMGTPMEGISNNSVVFVPEQK